MSKKIKLLKKIVNGDDTKLTFKETGMATIIKSNFTTSQLMILLYLLKDDKKKEKVSKSNLSNHLDEYNVDFLNTGIRQSKKLNRGEEDRIVYDEV